MPTATPAQQSYQRGVIYAIAAGVFLSSGGLLVRFLDDADVWSVLFYRSLAFFVTVVGFMLVRNAQPGAVAHFRFLRLRDLVVSVALALGFIFYVLSLYSTSVANTVFLLSTGPFFAALLGFLVLREVVGWRTWLAMLTAAIGVAVMMSEELDATDLLGMGYSVLAVMSFACMIVALRSVGPNRDMMAATALAGLFAAVFCLPFISTFSMSIHDFLLSLCLGSVQVGSGFILITLSSRSVPSAQIPLFTLGETALAPLWVWLVVDETPATNTLLGGAVILIAVIFVSIVDVHSATGQEAPVEEPIE